MPDTLVCFLENLDLNCMRLRTESCAAQFITVCTLLTVLDLQYRGHMNPSHATHTQQIPSSFLDAKESPLHCPLLLRGWKYALG